MLDHLIVDGNNVLHTWGQGQSLAVARQTLLRDLELAAALRGGHCTVVFDGAPIEDVTHASSAHLTVLFGGRASADTVIERLVCQRKERCGVVVVTNDRMLGNLAFGWGAHTWSAAMLQQWLQGPSA